ncbi:MAG: ATP-dependent sacrificial sulfur transferase LarE [Firmicutes bacterium]|nr:ATP-dependent sacrificial sulfur transferase LarE [Bacillota bacterium]
MQNKLTQLQKNIAASKGAVVAYSGGVDSTFLAWVAHRILRDKVLMVTAISPLHPRSEQEFSIELAKQFCFPQQVIRTNELEDKLFIANPPQRCYYCKKAFFSTLKKIAAEKGFTDVFDGTNYDDLTDFRPGMQAAKELGIKSPLAQVKLTKAEIRSLSKQYNLPTWDKPSFACLASRIPYGEQITAEKLARVEQAELFLRTLSLKQLRVRCHGNLARVEVIPAEHSKILAAAAEINAYFKKLGFLYVTLDLQGYRTGSMNEQLENF